MKKTEKKTKEGLDEEAVPLEAEEVKLDVEKDIITDIPEEEVIEKIETKVDVAGWKPKTRLGQKVKNGEITSIAQIIDSGERILEPNIVDILLPSLETELLMIGQAKGKFGGGQKRAFKQTQKKSPEGNKPHFSCMIVTGNANGYVGVGSGSAKDTLPAREKALRNAKLNIIRIRRGCGSWECNCKTPHSIPYEVSGKCGSATITLKPAPKGKGLCVEAECAKILRLAGIKDVWSKARGQTRTKMNLIKACIDALKNLSKIKIDSLTAEKMGMVEGEIKSEEAKE